MDGDCTINGCRHDTAVISRVELESLYGTSRSDLYIINGSHGSTKWHRSMYNVIGGDLMEYYSINSSPGSTKWHRYTVPINQPRGTQIYVSCNLCKFVLFL